MRWPAGIWRDGQAWPAFDTSPYVARWFDEKRWTCVDLVRVFYRRELGIRLPRYVTDLAAKAESFNAVKASGQWCQVDRECFGDVVAFRRRAGEDVHVGVVVAPKTMLHVLRDAMTVTQRYDHRAWAPRLSGFWRWQ